MTIQPFPFDLDLLRAFVAVTETGGFTRGAEKIGRSQSTISLQIKKLEDNLGHRLLQRNGKELLLTPMGEVLIVYANQILKLAEEATARVLEPDVSGTIRLGTPEDFATFYLPEILAKFAEAHPGVILDVTCNFSFNLLDSFGRGEFDLVLVKREPQGPVGGIPVWRDVLVWVGSPKSAAISETSVSLVLAPAPDVYRKRALSGLESIQRPWRVVFTSPSSEGLQAAVRAGLGITVMSKSMVPDGFTILDARQGLPLLPDTEIALYRAPGKISRAAELLAEHIVHSLEAPHKSGNKQL